jgi:hypothetical protein
VKPPIQIRTLTHEGMFQATIDAGPRGVERIVPPAGEAYAFEVQTWARNVVVYVSPKGRSVRVWVDGVEIPR